MYISNEDLQSLKDLEVFLWNFGTTREYLKLYDIIERLEQKKEISNKKNLNRIKAKRVINKMYARKKA